MPVDWSPRNLAQQAMQGLVLNLIGGSALALIAGVLAPVLPFTANWNAYQIGVFVVGLSMGAFVLGVIGVAVAQSTLAPLRAMAQRGAEPTAIRVADASSDVLPEILRRIISMLDGQAQHFDRLDAATQRARAAAAEEITNRVRAENEALLNQFEQSEASAREAREEAGNAQGALDKAIDKAVESMLQVQQMETLHQWAKGLIDDERPIANRLTIVRKRCLFAPLRQGVGPHFLVEITLRYTGVFPVTLSESTTGRLFYKDTRMGLDPETGGAFLSRGQEQSLYIAQYVGETERLTIEADLAANGKAEVDASHMHIPLTATLPDGTVVTEDFRPPYAIEGITPWPSVENTEAPQPTEGP